MFQGTGQSLRLSSCYISYVFMITTIVSDLMAVLKCIALSNIPPKHSSNFTAVDLKKSDQEWFEGCKQFSSKGI